MEKTVSIFKYMAALITGIIAVLEPTLRFAVVLCFAVLLDCFSAFDLSRRLKKQYPDKVIGKFQSRYALKILITFLQAYGVIILLHLVDEIILTNFNYLNLSNVGAAVFCGLQLWSILENISSGNGAKWAKMMQKIMVDKSKRHFNINLSDEKNNNASEHPGADDGM